jgi:lipopolysaccharide/colanic/teichoic acid biosynthesis glycosyltransferase
VFSGYSAILFLSAIVTSVILIVFFTWRGIAVASKIDIRPQKALQLVIKRMADILISGTLLLFTAPILLVITILIKMSSGGPVLFRQKRLGWGKREFYLYKFRTMYPSLGPIADVENFNFRIRNDPRITRIGRVLKRYSLDELPQLINIFKGDMSLVGPWPMLAYESRHIDRKRFSTWPGMTSLWQIDGKTNLSFEDRMKLDIDYVTNWSIILDIKILLKTIPAVLFGTGSN